MLKRIGARRYVVMSADGKKRLSKPLTKGAAKKRLQQIEVHKEKDPGGY